MTLCVYILNWVWLILIESAGLSSTGNRDGQLGCKVKLDWTFYGNYRLIK